VQVDITPLVLLVTDEERGAYRGRKRALSDADIAVVKICVVDGDNKSDIARDSGISRETLYQYLRKEN
jgi:hypothetical protein